MPYTAAERRYDRDIHGDIYRRAGRSGLVLPRISLGLWHNFGEDKPREAQKAILFRAFDRGVTHFDLANNYGPPYGAAERTFGEILCHDLMPYRDELIISTKAGYDMWPGPYGDGGSRKYLTASLDQSLRRMGLDYVDVFYSHRRDPDTPLEETMGALATAVRSGKALYVGISSYSPEDTARAAAVLRDLGTPLVLHQPRYSMLDRRIEEGERSLLDVLDTEALGAVVFSPLEQGVLTDRYLDGIPADSRAAGGRYLTASAITDERIATVRRLAPIAAERGQTIAQLALAWVLRHDAVTSAIVGASSVAQLDANLDTLGNLDLSPAELDSVEKALAGQ
jgi:L-glyceraldehyde 3-phosphate reductase